MIRICYFARLAEELDCRGEEMEAAPGTTVRNIIDTLNTRGEPWNSTLSNGKVLAAVNQTMCSLDQAVEDGDEVALFPPVTGG